VLSNSSSKMVWIVASSILIDFTAALFAVVVVSSASTTVERLLIPESMRSGFSKLCSVEWTWFEFPILPEKFEACL